MVTYSGLEGIKRLMSDAELSVTYIFQNPSVATRLYTFHPDPNLAGRIHYHGTKAENNHNKTTVVKNRNFTLRKLRITR